jgi:hypothetical protein
LSLNATYSDFVGFAHVLEIGFNLVKMFSACLVCLRELKYINKWSMSNVMKIFMFLNLFESSCKLVHGRVIRMSEYKP